MLDIGRGKCVSHKKELPMALKTKNEICGSKLYNVLNIIWFAFIVLCTLMPDERIYHMVKIFQSSGRVSLF